MFNFPYMEYAGTYRVEGDIIIMFALESHCLINREMVWGGMSDWGGKGKQWADGGRKESS